MRTQLITPPVDEPLTIAEARMHMKSSEVSFNDAEVLWFIKAAREQVEYKTDLRLMTQTWDMHIERFLDPIIELPYAPVQSVTSVTYFDTDGVSQVLSTDDYEVDTSGRDGRVLRGYGKTWPSTRGHNEDVTIRFVVGYPSVEQIPESVKHWMKCFIESVDKNRGLTQARDIVVSPWADRLLDGIRHFSV